MIKNIYKLFLTILIFTIIIYIYMWSDLFISIVLASSDSLTMTDLSQVVNGIAKAAKTGKWALSVGLFVMFLTRFLYAGFKDKIPKWLLPWIAVILGVIGQTLIGLGSGLDWFDSILGGITAGLTAAGSYSAFGKYIPGMKEK
jgi:hypothetical protein